MTSSAPPASAGSGRRRGSLSEIERLGAAVIEPLAPERGRKRLREPDVDVCVDDAAALAALLGRLAEGLAGTSEDADALARRALGVARTIWRRAWSSTPTRVVWAEPGAVAWAPVDVSESLREALWDTRRDAPSSSPRRSSRRSSGNGSASTTRPRSCSPSPFAFDEQAILYVPDGLPEPRAPGYEERLADEVLELCRLSRGRALVLTSSYRDARRARRRVLAEGLPYPVLRQGDAPRERLLERFREEVDSVLVATATFWQGVDVPGESLSLLVIDKLPFAPPDDPLVQARCERIAAAGGDRFAEYSVPTAILQLRQGFGRLIRGHDDRGVVAILDRRLRTRLYGQAVSRRAAPVPARRRPGRGGRLLLRRCPRRRLIPS